MPLPRYRSGEATGSLERPCQRPLVVAVAPGSPADACRAPPRRRGRARQRAGAARHHRVAAVVRRGRRRAWTSPATGSTSSSTSTSRPASRSAPRCRAPLFDRVRTCDNHCEFCFIYQLPKGLRRSLYLKDDDYRLSFLYGNFTTLTRFTESDLERVVTEGLSPLHVSIHSTDPALRARDAAQPAWRDEPALAARPARPRHRGARPDRRLPRRQRRTSARRHVRRHPRRVPRAELGRRRAARRLPLQPGAGDAPAHAGRGGGRRRRRRGLAGRLPGRPRPPAGPRRRRVLPDGRPAVPGRRRATTASRCTRTASAWPARSSSSSTAGRRRHRRPARVLRRRRCRRLRVLDRCPRTPPRTPGCGRHRRRAGRAAAASPGAGRRPDRRARRPGRRAR